MGIAVNGGENVGMLLPGAVLLRVLLQGLHGLGGDHRMHPDAVRGDADDGADPLGGEVRREGLARDPRLRRVRGLPRHDLCEGFYTARHQRLAWLIYCRLVVGPKSAHPHRAKRQASSTFRSTPKPAARTGALISVAGAQHLVGFSTTRRLATAPNLSVPVQLHALDGVFAERQADDAAGLAHGGVG